MKKVLFVASIYVVAATGASAQWTQPSGTNIVSWIGNVGIGTTTPSTLLHVVGSSPTTQYVFEENSNPAGTGGFLAKNNVNNAAEFGVRGTARGSYGPLVAGDGYMYANGSFTMMADNSGVLKFATNPNLAVPLERMRIDIDGNVGIGVVPNGASRLQVSGNINVTGNINAKYQDIAEWVPSSGAMAPGTVVVISDDITNTVVPSARAYDTHVAGVVSARPGVVLGEEGSSKAMIATTGRVKVRVDASKHPIACGDLLVTSDRPGLAMFSEPLDLGGTKIHRPGTLIGKALEPLRSGEGEILVLLSMQ
jgi:hypothetical protein